jgi:hypothetical protein
MKYIKILFFLFLKIILKLTYQINPKYKKKNNLYVNKIFP